MVHIVKKKIRNESYLYLQRSVYVDKGKRKTEHIKYLGKEGDISKENLGKIVEFANKYESSKILSRKLDLFMKKLR